MCGRFITNRSARASKVHRCIFGLQTSSHSPGPRCPACADTPISYSRQAPVLGLGHLLDGPSSPPQGGELGRLFPAAVLVESLFVRRAFGEIRQRTGLEVLLCLPTGGAGRASFLLLLLLLLRRGLRSRLGGRRYGRRLCGAPRPVAATRLSSGVSPSGGRCTVDCDRNLEGIDAQKAARTNLVRFSDQIVPRECFTESVQSIQ